MSDLSGVDLTEGLRMLQAGQLTDAANFFSNIVQSDNQNGPAFGYLGIALTRLGQTEPALQALGQASQLQPQEPAAQYNVAIGLMHAGRHQDAIPFLQYTLQLDPTHAQAQAALAGISAAPAPSPAYEPYVSQPAAYQQSAFGAQPVSAMGQAPLSGPVYPAAAQPQGMNYQQTARPQVVHVAPNPGTRLLRGLGWGALYGQVWTGWNLFWAAVWNFKDFGIGGMLFLLCVFLVAFTIGGMIAGLIISALPPTIQSGVIVGVVLGLVFFGLEILFEGGVGSSYINIFFWFFTGRFVGANIAARVHRPIQQ